MSPTSRSPSSSLNKWPENLPELGHPLLHRVSVELGLLQIDVHPQLPRTHLHQLEFRQICLVAVHPLLGADPGDLSELQFGEHGLQFELLDLLGGEVVVDPLRLARTGVL